MIDAACKVSLPSTLVKTIYLFFDLPAAATTVTVTDLTENATETEDEMLKNNEKLHDMIGQIMEGLCRFKLVFV